MSGERRIVTLHVGADAFLRTAYLPDQWEHRLSVISGTDFTPVVESKNEALLPQDVAGPLCFSGDLLARERMLPRINPNDIVVIHDAGGYTISMYSRYNSRLCPAVYAYRWTEDGFNEESLQLIKAKEAWEDVSRFWS